MRDNDLNAYLNYPCRCRLKSGKEVFGVLADGGTPGILYFFTNAEARRTKLSLDAGIKISLGEIAGIEKLD